MNGLSSFFRSFHWYVSHPMICTRHRVLIVTFCKQPVLFQWLPFGRAWYQMGKTSGNSRWNLPGKLGWITMEIPGFLSLVYSMNVLPAKLGTRELPFENKLLGSLFVSNLLVVPGFCC